MFDSCLMHSNHCGVVYWKSSRSAKLCGRKIAPPNGAIIDLQVFLENARQPSEKFVMLSEVSGVHI